MIRDEITKIIMNVTRMRIIQYFALHDKAYPHL